MTALLDMRDRLAGLLMIELRTAGLASGADIAFRIADRALAGVEFEALVGFIAEAEGAATAFETAFDTGLPPTDIETRRDAWRSRRDILRTDDIYASLIP